MATSFITRVVQQREDDVTTAVPPRLPERPKRSDHSSRAVTGPPVRFYWSGAARSSGGSPVMAGSLPVGMILTRCRRAIILVVADDVPGSTCPLSPPKRDPPLDQPFDQVRARRTGSTGRHQLEPVRCRGVDRGPVERERQQLVVDPQRQLIVVVR